MSDLAFPRMVRITADDAYEIQWALDQQNADDTGDNITARWRRMRVHGSPLSQPQPEEAWVTEIGEVP